MQHGPLTNCERELQTMTERGELVGAVTALWHRDRVLHQHVVGHSDLSRTTAMRMDTLFRVASMSKPITSFAALMLLEAGRFALSDPVTRWLPEFAKMNVLRDADGDLADVVPASRPITMLDLLTHRAGFGFGFSTPGPLGRAYDTGLGSPFYSALDSDEWIRTIAQLPLLYAPGERFSYGHSTDVLGVVLERITDMSLPELLAAYIFDRIGMTHTTFGVTATQSSAAAENYEFDSESRSLKRVWWLDSPDLEPRFKSAGQGLWTTIEDYLRFARLLLGCGRLEEEELLSPATFARLTRNVLTDAQRQHPVLGWPMWSAMDFGLGVAVIARPDTLMALSPGHAGALGWPGILGTWWQVDPQADAALLYFTGLVSLGAVAQAAPGARGQSLFRQAAYAAIEHAR